MLVSLQHFTNEGIYIEVNGFRAFSAVSYFSAVGRTDFAAASIYVPSVVEGEYLSCCHTSLRNTDEVYLDILKLM